MATEANERGLHVNRVERIDGRQAGDHKAVEGIRVVLSLCEAAHELPDNDEVGLEGPKSEEAANEVAVHTDEL